MRKSLQDFEQGKYKSLRATQAEPETWRYNKVTQVVVAGRAAKGLQVGYDKVQLPLMTPKHRYIVLLLKKIHEEDHGGDGRVVDKARSKFWIPQAGKVVKCIRRNCFECKRIEKRLQNQIMAPLPTFRMMVSNPWRVVSLDLFGPLVVRDSVNMSDIKMLGDYL